MAFRVRKLFRTGPQNWYSTAATVDSCRVGVYLSLLFHVVLVYCIICNVILFFRLIESFVYPTLAALSLAVPCCFELYFSRKGWQSGRGSTFFLAPKLEIPFKNTDNSKKSYSHFKCWQHVLKTKRRCLLGPFIWQSLAGGGGGGGGGEIEIEIEIEIDK